MIPGLSSSGYVRFNDRKITEHYPPIIITIQKQVPI